MKDNPRAHIKKKFKAFFKMKEATDSGIELLEKFILPFSRQTRRLGVDDMLEAFFSLNDRVFLYAKANRDFKLPGKYMLAGNRPVYGLAPREIKKGKVFLIVLDRKDRTAKLEIVIKEVAHNFLLEIYEFETIKDWLDVIS